MSDSADTFRWQSFFQHAAQPMFLVNRRRKLLFVNRAWEACTGLRLVDMKGRVCRRRTSSSALDGEEAILASCAPPREAVDGVWCQVRKRAPQGSGWWEIHFLPLAGPNGLLGILGTIRVLGERSEPSYFLPDKLMALRDRSDRRYLLEDFGHGTPALERIHEQARLAAQTRMPILIAGEPGSGKRWLARAIHVLGDHRHGYFASLDAKTLPPHSLEEILFSSRASQLGLGTVYLRGAACLPREWQARLADTILRRDQADFPRVIVGMGGGFDSEVAQGGILDEFYCAASAITIVVPPLRERLPHLPHFIQSFMARAQELAPHGVQSVTDEALSALRVYRWPGNLCELQEIINTACRRVKTDRIDLGDLPFFVKQGALPAERRLPLDVLLEQVERRLIVLALNLTQDNQTRAAELLEIWRPRLMRRMEKFGLET